MDNPANQVTVNSWLWSFSLMIFLVVGFASGLYVGYLFFVE